MGWLHATWQAEWGAIVYCTTVQWNNLKPPSKNILSDKITRYVVRSRQTFWMIQFCHWNSKLLPIEEFLGHLFAHVKLTMLQLLSVNFVGYLEILERKISTHFFKFTKHYMRFHHHICPGNSTLDLKKTSNQIINCFYFSIKPLWR